MYVYVYTHMYMHAGAHCMYITSIYRIEWYRNLHCCGTMTYSYLRSTDTYCNAYPYRLKGKNCYLANTTTASGSNLPGLFPTGTFAASAWFSVIPCKAVWKYLPKPILVGTPRPWPWAKTPKGSWAHFFCCSSRWERIPRIRFHPIGHVSRVCLTMGSPQSIQFKQDFGAPSVHAESLRRLAKIPISPCQTWPPSCEKWCIVAPKTWGVLKVVTSTIPSGYLT